MNHPGFKDIFLYKGVIGLIMDKLNDVTNSYKKDSTFYLLSLFFQEHIHEIPYITIDEVASRSHVSKSQISKYVRYLDYHNYIDFKDACLEYLESLEHRRYKLSNEKTIKEMSIEFIYNIEKLLSSTLRSLDFQNLERLVQDLINTNTIYVFAQGDARYLCHLLQIELQLINKNVIICDGDFNQFYGIQKNNLLLVLSVNGNTFKYNQRVVKRIEDVKGKKWLITSKNNISFKGIELFIPIKNSIYRDYIYKHIIDLIIMKLQNK